MAKHERSTNTRYPRADHRKDIADANAIEESAESVKENGEEARRREVIRKVLAKRYRWDVTEISENMIDAVLAGPPPKDSSKP